MFHSISWQSYITTMCIGLLLYYVLLLLAFNRHRLKARLQNELQPVPATAGLVDELRDVLREAVINNHTREKLLQSLHSKLLEYPQIKGSARQAGINAFIAQLSPMHLTETELQSIW